MDKTFRQSMEVGYYFNKELCDDDRTDDWSGSEECSTFTQIIVDYANKNNYDIDFVFYKFMDEIINGINNETIYTDDHMWNSYCKGFLAGEILGMPTKENLDKVKKAEQLWKNSKYGYYQEVLEEVI